MARETPAYLKALGRDPLPGFVEAGGRRYALARVFKHDFFAATALYECEGDRVVLKLQRKAPLLFMPLSWVGRILAARERAALRRLAGLPGIPRHLGDWGPCGLIRQYMEGSTLDEVDRVADDFHSRLRRLIDAVHAREMAYVDLEKPGNVVVGRDGQPVLFDFQISWYWPRRWGGDLAPMRAIRRWFQRGDLYHLAKLQRRTRPDQLSPEQLAASYRKPWYIRLHNLLTRPFTRMRRLLLHSIDPARHARERGRENDERIMEGG